jgi:hypothetical protein
VKKRSTIVRLPSVIPYCLPALLTVLCSSDHATKQETNSAAIAETDNRRLSGNRCGFQNPKTSRAMLNRRLTRATGFAKGILRMAAYGQMCISSPVLRLYYTHVSLHESEPLGLHDVLLS